MVVPPPVETALVGQPDVADSATRLAGLFDTHADRLYRLARRLTANAEDARDLVQDTFVRAAARSSSIPVGAGPEEAWLVRVMVNLQRDRWRRTSVRVRHDGAIALTNDASQRSDQESALIARTTVRAALEKLPPRRRAILVLHELEGLDARAIASLLHITPITVRWHLSRGRRELASLVTATRGERG